jgi:signal transduction histidine kinase
MGVLIFSTEASVMSNGAEQAIEMSTAKRAFFEDPVPRLDWSDIGASDHFIQLYEEDAHLLDTVSRFTSTGLEAGEAVVVIATQVHRDHLEARFRAHGVDLTTMRKQGQYVPLDATETLAQFMVNGWPDPRRFADVVGSAIAQARGRYARVRAFGEMVALLWAEGNEDAALQLEKLWGYLIEIHTFPLFCAYPMSCFSRAVHAKKLLKICDEHSHIIPAESYTTLTSPDERLRTIVQLQQKARALEAEMAERKELEKALRQREDELRQSHAELEQRVEERTAALHHEIAERQRLERDAQRAAHFVLLGRLAAGVSHEIRNPLGAVFLHVDLLAEELQQPTPGNPADITELITEIKINLTRLDNLVQDYLSLVRVASLQLDMQDLGMAVQAWTSEFQALAVARGVTIQQEGVTGLGLVAFHANTLRRALLNLVQNALDAVPQGSMVTLAGQRTATEVRLHIQDTGHGIPAEQLGQIFEPLYTTKPGGTGLGLYIVQEIMTAHGGQVAVDSVQGQGTTFTLTLPCFSNTAPVSLAGIRCGQ